MTTGTQQQHRDLERRRLAIVRALRGEPDAPPVVPVEASRLRQLEQDVAAVRSQLADLSAHLGQLTTARTDPAYDGYPEPPDDAAESPRVPPLDATGGMSKRAAEALFGY